MAADGRRPAGAASRLAWVSTRRHLVTHRRELTRSAARLYPRVPAVAGTSLLARPGWLRSGPLPLSEIGLVWEPEALAPDVDGAGPVAAHLVPGRPGGGRYGSYVEALAALDRPAVFENRTCYRLLEVVPGTHAGPRLVFGVGRYFDSVNTGEALAHEYAQAALDAERAAIPDGSDPDPPMRALPLRRLVGDPCDPGRRAMLPAVSVLTVRHDPRGGDARMLLHWRDPARVATNNGLFQVVPVGVFQPSAEGRWNLLADFDLERCIVREASEELLGQSEDHGSARAALDYDSWPFHQQWRAARAAGSLRLWWLGMGVDPLTLSTDLLVVAVVDAPAFDDLFGGLVNHNDEGDILAVPFTADEVLRFSAVEPMQPAGAALLRLAWQHRGTLLAPYDPG